MNQWSPTILRDVFKNSVTSLKDTYQGFIIWMGWSPIFQRTWHQSVGNTLAGTASEILASLRHWHHVWPKTVSLSPPSPSDLPERQWKITDPLKTPANSKYSTLLGGTTCHKLPAVAESLPRALWLARSHTHGPLCSAVCVLRASVPIIPITDQKLPILNVLSSLWFILLVLKASDASSVCKSTSLLWQLTSTSFMSEISGLVALKYLRLIWFVTRGLNKWLSQMWWKERCNVEYKYLLIG